MCNGMSLALPAGCWTHLSRTPLCGEGVSVSVCMNVRLSASVYMGMGIG